MRLFPASYAELRITRGRADMSHVSVSPEVLTAAAADLKTIACAVAEAHHAAVPVIRTLLPAAADEVSVRIANVFAEHAQEYQVAARVAAAFQEQFVLNLYAGAASYVGVEGILVYLLQSLDAGVQWVWGEVTQQMVNFISGADSWLSLVPGPLQAFVVGIPFLSIFVGAIPFILLSTVIQNMIVALGG